MDMFEKKYGLREDHVVKDYHCSRRMFCIHENKLHIADMSASYSHAVWFEKMGWISASDDASMDKIVRGFVDKEGNIFFYVGYDFTVNDDVEKIFFHHPPRLTKDLKLDHNGLVFGGMIKQDVGGKWPSRKVFGTIRKCLCIRE